MLFQTLKKKNYGVKQNSGGGGGGGVDFFFRKTIFFYFTFYAIFNIKKNNIEKCPFTYWLNGRFDFIECFTTTFLRAHSWLNWVDEDDDEDEVGLKEKPEDTRYIKKITSK